MRTVLLSCFAWVLVLGGVAGCAGGVPVKEGATVALAYHNVEYYFDRDRPLALLGEAGLDPSERALIASAAEVAESVRRRVDALQDNPQALAGHVLTVEAEYRRVRLVYERLYALYQAHRSEYSERTRRKLEAFHRDANILDEQFAVFLQAADRAKALVTASDTVGLLLRIAVARGV